MRACLRAQAADGAGQAAASRLGSTADLQFFASKLRDVCVMVDGVEQQVGLALSGGAGLEAADGGRAAAQGFGGSSNGGLSTDNLDLLNRQLKAYLAAY